MAHIEKSVTIDAPVDRVFAYVTDIQSIPQWWPIEVRNATAERAAKGVKYDWTYRMLGIPFHGTSEHVEVQPGERILIQSTGGIPNTLEYRLASQEGKTVVTMTMDYTVPGSVLGKLADKLVIERVNDNAAANIMANLKTICEAQAVGAA
jgi:uncharacterized membrane protein